MYITALTLSALVAVASSSECKDVNAINRSLRDDYCDQPMFITFMPKTQENTMLDNVCLTYFPLPDDPDTFQIYTSRVYCDGSNDVISLIGTQFEQGVTRKANPFITYTETVFGYAGCDTYLVYSCVNFGAGNLQDDNIVGISAACRSIGLSCLRKVEEIVRDNGLPEEEYYILPMKLPNRCVTQQLCLAPPNPFYNHLAGVGVALI